MWTILILFKMQKISWPIDYFFMLYTFLKLFLIDNSFFYKQVLSIVLIEFNLSLQHFSYTIDLLSSRLPSSAKLCAYLVSWELIFQLLLGLCGFWEMSLLASSIRSLICRTTVWVLQSLCSLHVKFYFSGLQNLESRHCFLCMCKELIRCLFFCDLQ